MDFSESSERVQAKEKGFSELPSIFKDSLNMLLEFCMLALVVVVFLVPWAVVALFFVGLYFLLRPTIRFFLPQTLKAKDDESSSDEKIQ